jgi:hypothetical protein
VKIGSLNGLLYRFPYVTFSQGNAVHIADW